MVSEYDYYRGFLGLSFKLYPDGVKNVETLLQREGMIYASLGIIFVLISDDQISGCFSAIIIYLSTQLTFSDLREQRGFQIIRAQRGKIRNLFRFSVACWIVSKLLLMTSVAICIWVKLFS